MRAGFSAAGWIAFADAAVAAVALWASTSPSIALSLTNQAE